jgi:hypothetical protein
MQGFRYDLIITYMYLNILNWSSNGKLAFTQKLSNIMTKKMFSSFLKINKKKKKKKIIKGDNPSIRNIHIVSWKRRCVIPNLWFFFPVKCPFAKIHEIQAK